MDFTLAIALLSIFAFAITLLRHILLKRELFKLKADMKKVGDIIMKEWLEKSGAEGKAIVDAFKR